MLSKEEVYKYNYILNQLGKRILPQFFYEKSPEKMIYWQNQICRQCHVISAYFIDKWLNPGNELNYNVRFYESIFKDKVTKAVYDHSWVFIESRLYPKDRYICDIARISEHIGFRPVEDNNPDMFLLDSELKNARQFFDFRVLLEDIEYYSNMYGKDLVCEIEERLKANRLV
jgi:hypothetical protein